MERLVAEGKDNSHDARAAIEKTLASVGHRFNGTGTPRGATSGQLPPRYTTFAAGP